HLGDSHLTDLFHRLLDCTLDEIVQREPAYFSQFAVGIASPSRAAEELIKNQVVRNHSVNEIELALNEGLAYFTSRGVKISSENCKGDPVGDLLLRAITDAFSAAKGELPLEPCATTHAPFTEVLEREYDQRKTADGVRYFIRRQGQGTRPLLLITATGIPLVIWSQLLADQTLDFRIVVVESRGADLIKGGIRQFAELPADAEDISKVLDAEGLSNVSLVGWCNGGRLAIETAVRCAARIRSLVLVAPALSGFKGVPRIPSRFEASMKKVFATLSQKPRLAGIYVNILQEQPPDWATLVDPEARASALFGLPPRDQAVALQSPMANVESLLNYGCRLASDAAHPVEEAFLRIEQPMMLITGNYDSQVNNDFILSVLRSRAWKTPVIHAGIVGSGHYPHYLQYPYFGFLLQSFFLKGQTPATTARVQIETVS
ncbi:MAG: alpha/beta hydrolase, partial [Candidatus Sulfotelmatobacter sp.]